MKWTEVNWDLFQHAGDRSRRKAERFAELYGRGSRGVIESPADLTMREVIDLKRRFEAGELTPAEAAEITHRLSIAEPVSQKLPEGPYALG